MQYGSLKYDIEYAYLILRHENKTLIDNLLAHFDDYENNNRIKVPDRYMEVARDVVKFWNVWHSPTNNGCSTKRSIEILRRKTSPNITSDNDGYPLDF